MKNVIKYLLLGLIVVSQFFACGGSDDNKTPADNFDVQFTVPGSVDVTEGGECTFAVTGGGGKSPLTTDTFSLESAARSAVGRRHLLCLPHHQLLFRKFHRTPGRRV